MDYDRCAREMLLLLADVRRHEAGRTLNRGMSGETVVLYHLSGHGGRAHPKELSQHMEVSTARIAAILGHLEEEGYITRQRQDDDKRQILVALTEKGRRFLEEHTRMLLERFRRMFEVLGEEDTQAYLRIQRKLLAYFDQRRP